MASLSPGASGASTALNPYYDRPDASGASMLAVNPYTGQPQDLGSPARRNSSPIGTPVSGALPEHPVYQIPPQLRHFLHDSMSASSRFAGSGPTFVYNQINVLLSPQAHSRGVLSSHAPSGGARVEVDAEEVDGSDRKHSLSSVGHVDNKAGRALMGPVNRRMPPGDSKAEHRALMTPVNRRMPPNDPSDGALVPVGAKSLAEFAEDLTHSEAGAADGPNTYKPEDVPSEADFQSPAPTRKKKSTPKQNCCSRNKVLLKDYCSRNKVLLKACAVLGVAIIGYNLRSIMNIASAFFNGSSHR